MKIEIQKTKIKKVINSAKKLFANSKKEVLPKLQFETQDNQVVLIGKDDKNILEIKIDCNVIEDGEVTLNYLKLEQILKEIKEKNIILETKNDNIIINNEIELKEIKCKKIEKIKNDLQKNILLDKNKFIENLKKVSFCSSKKIEETNFFGVTLEINKFFNDIEYISCDSYRFAKISKKLNELLKGINIEDLKAIIPLNVVKCLEVLKAFDKEEDVKLNFDENKSKIIFEFGNITISSDVLSNNFSDFNLFLNQHLSEKENKKTVFLDTDVFKEYLKDFLKVSKDVKNDFILRFDFKDNELILHPSKTEIFEKIKINYKEKETKISLNLKFLLEFINLTDSKKIEINFFDKRNSVSFNINDNFKYLLMPIKAIY